MQILTRTLGSGAGPRLLRCSQVPMIGATFRAARNLAMREGDIQATGLGRA